MTDTDTPAATPAAPPPARCPRCDSPDPRLHPAVQAEGEVQPCPDPWHVAPDLPAGVLDVVVRLAGAARAAGTTAPPLDARVREIVERAITDRLPGCDPQNIIDVRPDPTDDGAVIVHANMGGTAIVCEEALERAGYVIEPIPSPDGTYGVLLGVRPRPSVVRSPRPRVWVCKIGARTAVGLLSPADPPMRAAVERAFRDVTGHAPDFLFTGWGGNLTEGELAVVEGRDPVPPPDVDLLEDMDGAPFPDEVQVAHRLAMQSVIADLLVQHLRDEERLTARVTEITAERDDLLDYENTIASRIPDPWDMDTGQPAVIDRWLDAVTERMRDVDPAGYAWLFEGGEDPRPEADR